VHHAVVDDDIGAEDMANALVSQADAERGDLRTEDAMISLDSPDSRGEHGPAIPESAPARARGPARR